MRLSGDEELVRAELEQEQRGDRPWLWVGEPGRNLTLPLVFLLLGFTIKNKLVNRKKRDRWIKARQMHSRDRTD